jgi:hypothetical protein
MKKLMIVVAILVTLGSCYNYKYDKLFPVPVGSCDTTNITYSKDIAPIVAANCAISGGCHDVAGSLISGHDYTTYAGLKAVAEYDFIITDINGIPVAGHNSMPKNGLKLSDCDINKITRWVNEGAPDN